MSNYQCLTMQLVATWQVLCKICSTSVMLVICKMIARSIVKALSRCHKIIIRAGGMYNEIISSLCC